MPIKKLLDAKMGFLSKQANVLSARLRVIPDHHSYSPGDEVHVRISLVLRKPIEARSLSARLYCVETSKVSSSYVMDTYDYQMDREIGVPRSTHIRTRTSTMQKTVHNERKRLGEHQVYQGGEYPVSFTLPASALRTRHGFGHNGKKAVWKIEAKLDVPLAPDISSTMEIMVG